MPGPSIRTSARASTLPVIPGSTAVTPTRVVPRLKAGTATSWSVVKRMLLAVSTRRPARDVDRLRVLADEHDLAARLVAAELLAAAGRHRADHLDALLEDLARDQPAREVDLLDGRIDDDLQILLLRHDLWRDGHLHDRQDAERAPRPPCRRHQAREQHARERRQRHPVRQRLAGPTSACPAGARGGESERTDRRVRSPSWRASERRPPSPVTMIVSDES